ncbi:MAG TPA: hypothetical protein VMR76_02265 [Candidatus Saccharimonadia bacterium]|nr:hypothetical protein [Candidatus Saccharimonadia bacterium]
MLTVNLEAQTLHAAGRDAELNGNFVEAHGWFDEAQIVLTSLTTTLDTDVQYATILRDDGFTYLRSAINTHSKSDLSNAARVLHEAKNKTNGQFSDNHWGLDSPKELFAEHGATLSCLGRLSTVAGIVFKQAEYSIPQWFYKDADIHLRSGNNGYYRVSNAMVAARYERTRAYTSESPPETKFWVARALAGLVWTELYDGRNLKPASRTFFGRLPHIATYGSAVRSVSVKP